MALLSTSHEIWMNIRNQRKLFCDIWKLYYTETYVCKYNFMRTLPGTLFECRLGCVCATKPGIFPLWPLKKKHVATSSSSQTRKQAQRSLETCPGSHSYKEKSQDLNPGCLLLIHQCYCFWMVLAGPKIQWCSQPGGHGVTGGQGNQRGLAMAGVRGWIHSWTLICLPFLGNQGRS